MTCKDIKELLSPYLDNVLQPNEQDLVEKHLHTCPRCRDEYFLLKEVSNMLTELPELKAPPDFSAQVRQRLEDEKSKKQKVVPLFNYTWTKYALPAAALLLIVGVSLTWGNLFNGNILASKSFTHPDKNPAALQEFVPQQQDSNLAADNSKEVEANNGEITNNNASDQQTQNSNGSDTSNDQADDKVNKTDGTSQPDDLNESTNNSNSTDTPDQNDSSASNSDNNQSDQIVIFNAPGMGNASNEKSDSNKAAYSIAAAEKQHIAYYAVVQLAVDDLDVAVKGIIDATARNGGGIKFGSRDKNSAQTLQIRMPVNNLSSYIDEISSLGRVKYKEITEDDLSDEYNKAQNELNSLIDSEQDLIEDLKDAESGSQSKQIQKEITCTEEKITDLQNRLRNITNEVRKAMVVVKVNK